jgi:hypothetical protein
MARTYTPYLLPVTWYNVEPTEVTQYISRHMDDYLLAERNNRWQHGGYRQPWITSDVIVNQFINNQGAVNIKVIDCKQNLLFATPMQQKQQNQYEPEYFIYESSQALNALPDGIYYLLAEIGSGPNTRLISEPIEVSGQSENTLLLQYKHRKYRGGVVFETGIEFSLRVHGFLRLQPPASKDTLYEDQVLDMVMVQSKPYRIWELVMFGPEGGLPDWMIDKLNWVLGCSDLRIDGKYYTKQEGAKIEEGETLQNGLLKSYRIEMREAINRNSKVFSGTENTNEALHILLNVSSKGFGDTTTGDSSNIFQVTDVE